MKINAGLVVIDEFKNTIKGTVTIIVTIIDIIDIDISRISTISGCGFNNDEGFSVGPVLFKGSGNVLDEFKFTLALLLDGNLGIELKGVTVAPDSA